MAKAFNAVEPFTIEGEEYRFAIDIGIIDKIEDEFDCGFDELLGKIGGGKVRMGKMTRLVKGLLSREHPDMTLDEVGGLIFAGGDEITGAMDRLFAKAWPEASGTAKAENPPKARRGTGANS